jgi:hypothetical protein
MIRRGHLYLTRIAPCSWPQNKTKPPDLRQLFPDEHRKGIVPAKWFTGVLRVPRGKQLKYIHAGYASLYERELQFGVAEGRVLRVVRFRNRIGPDGTGIRGSGLRTEPERSALSKARLQIGKRSSSCAGKPDGEQRIEVRMVIKYSGTVRTAKVKGPFAGTPLSRCIEKHVRRMKVPMFFSPDITVDFFVTLR